MSCCFPQIYLQKHRLHDLNVLFNEILYTLLVFVGSKLCLKVVILEGFDGSWKIELLQNHCFDFGMSSLAKGPFCSTFLWPSGMFAMMNTWELNEHLVGH